MTRSASRRSGARSTSRAPTDPASRALLLSLQSLELTFELDPSRRRELAQQALALAREIGDARTLASVLVDTLLAMWAPDTLELRQELLPELLDSAARAGDPALEFWATVRELDTRIEGCELERAAAAAERMAALSEQGEPSMRWNATFAGGAAQALLRGDLARAEELAEEALRIGSEADQHDARLIYGAQLTRIRVYQGRGGGAR